MIKLIVLDVDGCLTNSKISYLSNGEEIKSFDVKDGLAISSWIKLKRELAIITGRSSKIVEKRANELGIKYIYQGIKDKKEILLKLIDELNIDLSEVAAIGDDLNDLLMLQSVAWSFTPKNGSKEIQDRVDTILSRDGGDGAVREMIETIMKKDNTYNEFLKLWL